jgi:hypothetical protein
MKAKCLMIIIAAACAAAGCASQAPDVMQSMAAYTERPGQTSSTAPSRCAGLNGVGGDGRCLAPPFYDSGNTDGGGVGGGGP